MDTITITREQFNAAVEKCNNEFVAIVSKRDKRIVDKFNTLVMSMQNILFCDVVADELFKEKEGN